MCNMPVSAGSTPSSYLVCDGVSEAGIDTGLDAL